MEKDCAEVIVDVQHPSLDQIFHYRIPPHLPRPEIGSMVIVPFGPRQVRGWINGYSRSSAGIKLKEIISLSPEPGLSQELVALGHWMAERYLQPLAEFFKLMTPPPRPRRFVKTAPLENPFRSGRSTRFVLSGEQQKVLQEIEASLHKQEFRQFLLHGVTGSGKTEVYLRAAMTATARGRQVLYLVPEIALTPQTGAWFRGALGEQVAIWHSKIARGERYRIYEGISKGELDILIGPRSAVFAPFRDLGLIIIDEEHDPSYKQQAQPYYHARDVAWQRARNNRATMILGSATPSLESYTTAIRKDCRLLTICKRPAGRDLPGISLVDMRTERSAGNRSFLSRYLDEQIGRRLHHHEQVILFLNRRGFAALVFCPACGYVLKCRHCSISLVYHRATGDLRCHYCNFKTRPPAQCPRCGGSGISFLGTGVQRVEQDLRKLYPGARLQRLDLDTTRRKGDLARILGSFARREIDILLGTQMVTKGHDFPGVTLVGVLDADLSLNLPDYRAAERTYQQLTQVAGRAGRGPVSGEVVVQTFSPEHYSIVAACDKGYGFFYQEETRARKYLGYPPFSDLIRLRFTGAKEEDVASLAANFTGEIGKVLKDAPVTVIGPAPAPVPRVKDHYRWQLMLKGDCRGIKHVLRDCLRYHRKKTSVIISIEVDPYGF